MYVTSKFHIQGVWYLSFTKHIALFEKWNKVSIYFSPMKNIAFIIWIRSLFTGQKRLLFHRDKLYISHGKRLMESTKCPVRYGHESEKSGGKWILFKFTKDQSQLVTSQVKQKYLVDSNRFLIRSFFIRHLNPAKLPLSSCAITFPSTLFSVHTFWISFCT